MVLKSDLLIFYCIWKSYVVTEYIENNKFNLLRVSKKVKKIIFNYAWQKLYFVLAPFGNRKFSGIKTSIKSKRSEFLHFFTFEFIACCIIFANIVFNSSED